MSDLTYLTIPTDLRDPGTYIEFDNSLANGPLPAMPRKILILGQRLANSAVAAGVPTRMFKPTDGVAAFGRGSMLAVMVAALFAANTSTEVWAIAQDDNSAGTAAIWNAVFTGNAASAGTGTEYIGGTAVQFAITSGMTPAQRATAFAAAINALPDLPVTAAVDGVTTSQVDITAKWKGLTANDLDFRSHYYQNDHWPTGTAPTITVGTAGAANPSLTASIAAMGNVWYTDIITPYLDGASTTALATEMERRFGSTVQQDSLIYGMSPISLGALSSLGSGLNEKLLIIMGIPVCPTPSWVVAAVVGAVAAYNFSIDPCAPLDTLALPGVLAPAPADQLQHPDREALLHDGISNTRVDQGGNVTINRLITTYQVDANDVPDESYLGAETLAGLAYLRFWIRSRIATRWPRFKLADDPSAGQPLPSGARVTCPKLIKADLVAGSGDLYSAGIIDDVAAFAATIIVQRNSTSRDRVDSLLPWTLIGQFRIFAGQIQFLT